MLIFQGKTPKFLIQKRILRVKYFRYFLFLQADEFLRNASFSAIFMRIIGILQGFSFIFKQFKGKAPK